MVKSYSLFLIFTLLIFSSCNDENEKNTFYLNKDGNFTVINFADTQFDSVSDLKEGTILRNVMTKAIEESKPDLITFSGDNAWSNNTLSCYIELCAFMDNFKIPYYFTIQNVILCITFLT